MAMGERSVRCSGIARSVTTQNDPILRYTIDFLYRSMKPYSVGKRSILPGEAAVGVCVCSRDFPA
jgi:hypothetical protein